MPGKRVGPSYEGEIEYKIMCGSEGLGQEGQMDRCGKRGRCEWISERTSKTQGHLRGLMEP